MQRNDAACVIRAGTQSEESSRKYDFFGTARSAGPHGWWHEEDGFQQTPKSGAGGVRVEEGVTRSAWQSWS